VTALARKPGWPEAGLWSADKFLDFYAARPEGERWQLVDGLPMMMIPPTKVHQKLGKTFLTLLDRALERHRPELEAYYEVGLRIPGVDDFNPQPDIIVLPAEASFDSYADSFFLVAEIVSPSNTTEAIDRKLDLYARHPDNLYAIAIDQDSVHVRIHSRARGWARTDLRSLDDVLSLPEFGFEARLADLYKGTPLAR
jgi:Uma2 family endonuclease